MKLYDIIRIVRYYWKFHVLNVKTINLKKKIKNNANNYL